MSVQGNNYLGFIGKSSAKDNSKYYCTYQSINLNGVVFWVSGRSIDGDACNVFSMGLCYNSNKNSARLMFL